MIRSLGLQSRRLRWRGVVLMGAAYRVACRRCNAVFASRASRKSAIAMRRVREGHGSQGALRGASVQRPAADFKRHRAARRSAVIARVVAAACAYVLVFVLPAGVSSPWPI